jgi:hypothetical protein
MNQWERLYGGGFTTRSTRGYSMGLIIIGVTDNKLNNMGFQLLTAVVMKSTSLH